MLTSHLCVAVADVAVVDFRCSEVSGGQEFVRSRDRGLNLRQLRSAGLHCHGPVQALAAEQIRIIDSQQGPSHASGPAIKFAAQDGIRDWAMSHAGEIVAAGGR